MEAVWKVFVPHELLLKSHAHMFGHVNLSSQSVCIVASSPDPISMAAQMMRPIGTLNSNGISNGVAPRACRSSYDVWVGLKFDREGSLTCSLTYRGSDMATTCIIYDPSDLCRSSLLMDRCVSGNVNGEAGVLTPVMETLRRSKILMSDFQQNPDIEFYFGKPHCLDGALDRCFGILLAWTWLIYWPFQIILEERLSFLRAPSRMFAAPSVLSQLHGRANQLTGVNIFTSKIPALQRLRQMNICSRQCFDTCLGLVLMWFLMREGTSQQIAALVLGWADKIALELKDLLNWLMGAPAGLKVNSQLTHFLGHFFLYHIYLWTGFLYLLKPVLGQLVLYTSVTGVWGLSIQLSLFQDILSIMTIHIYCFYVYAARLYRLQIYALSSLWRLFRGKKWNVLRQRVDSAPYDVDQLFIGTLMFTILFFLLPTTALYYVVFTMLRLLVLMVQGSIDRVKNHLNTMPVWSVGLWLLGSKSLTDGPTFNLVQRESRSQNSLILTLQTQALPLSGVLSICAESRRSERKQSYSWGTFVANLFHGHLVYPWIDK